MAYAEGFEQVIEGADLEGGDGERSAGVAPVDSARVLAETDGAPLPTHPRSHPIRQDPQRLTDSVRDRGTIQRRDIHNDPLVPRDIRPSVLADHPPPVENDFRVGTGGELLENDVDRAH